jgi:Lon protease-like protein
VSVAQNDSIALFPLNIVLFPGGALPLRIFETRYVDMVRRCMRGSQAFGVALIREGNEVGPAETFDVGTLAKIVDFHQLSDGLLGLSCVGEQRFRIRSRGRQADGLNLAEVDWLAPEPTVAVPARHARLSELLKSVLPQLGEVYTGIQMRLDDAAWVGHRLAEILPIPLADKQRCLELDDPIERLDVLSPLVKDT